MLPACFSGPPPSPRQATPTPNIKTTQSSSHPTTKENPTTDQIDSSANALYDLYDLEPTSMTGGVSFPSLVLSTGRLFSARTFHL